MKSLKKLACYGALMLILQGCSQSAQKGQFVSAKPLVSQDGWTLRAEGEIPQVPPVLWNGLLGIHVKANGLMDERLYNIHGYVDENLKASKQSFQPKTALIPTTKGYSQDLDLKTGIVTTQWQQDGKQMKVFLALHPEKPEVYVQIEETSPQGKANILEAYVLTTLHKKWIANASPSAVAIGLEACRDIWGKRWKTDIEIDGPLEDQAAIRSMMFYLRSCVHPKADFAVSPFGLSNERYKGHVFWDADMWVGPSMGFIEPSIPAQIARYRIYHFNDQAVYLETHPQQTPYWKYVDSPYPWEGTNKIKLVRVQQVHVNADVLWALQYAYTLKLINIRRDGLAFASAMDNVLRYLVNTSELGKDGKYHFKQVIGPDEQLIVNDDLFTNAVSESLFKDLCSDLPQAQKGFAKPRDSKSFLNYDKDLLMGYKQAAGLLAAYPLQDPQVEKEALTMLRRFAPKVTAYGPAMSDSVNSIILTRNNLPDEGYEAWRKGWKEFMKGPFLQFSEKRSKSETYFITGAGGEIQSVVNGFLGFRVDSKKDPKANWSTPLNLGRWLNVTPRLPKAWKSVKFKNFIVLGQRYTLTATHETVRVEKTPSEKGG